MTEAIEERANTVRTTDRTSLTMDERIGSLFQSDSLLVAQYFETLRRTTLFEPEMLRWKEKRLIRRRNSEAWKKIMKEPQRRTA
jgi:hypothetical protein